MESFILWFIISSDLQYGNWYPIFLINCVTKMFYLDQNCNFHVNTRTRDVKQNVSLL